MRKGMPMIAAVDVATLRGWLADGGEIAFLDVREEGQHGAGHPLLAVNLPYSRLELLIGQLVPRRGCRVVLLDDDDGIADKAARRLAALWYIAVHILQGGVGTLSAAGDPLFPSGREGWRVAARGGERRGRGGWKPAGREAPAAAGGGAGPVARRYGIRFIDTATLSAWQAESDTRTTYLLDVRTPDEYAAGH